MRLPATGLAALLLLATHAATAAAPDGERRIAADLDAPVALAFRDGGILYAELNSGRLRLVPDEGASPPDVARVPASGGGNGGFTGLAVDPQDPRTVYVVYSVEKASSPTGKVNRVSKIVGDAETILLDDLPWAEFHVGGRVAVGPDGHLYVTTGDTADYRRQPGDHPDDPAQDPQSRRGKVLRMTRDGAPAGGVAGWNPYVYARGFRNPFGLAFGPDGTLYLADNGINHDEVNVVVQGANYGWPLCDGDCPAHQRPLTAWPDSFGTTGIAYHDGKLYVGDHNGARLRVVDAATGAASLGWATREGPVLDVAAGPDGCLYASTFEAIYQIDIRSAGGCGLGPVPPTPPVTTPAPTPSTPAPPPPGTPPTSGTTPPPTSAEGETPVTPTGEATTPPANDTPPEDAPPADANGTTEESVGGDRAPDESVGEDAAEAPGPALILMLAALAGAAVLKRGRR